MGISLAEPLTKIIVTPTISSATSSVTQITPTSETVQPKETMSVHDVTESTSSATSSVTQITPTSETVQPKETMSVHDVTESTSSATSSTVSLITTEIAGVASESIILPSNTISTGASSTLEPVPVITTETIIPSTSISTGVSSSLEPIPVITTETILPSTTISTGQETKIANLIAIDIKPKDDENNIRLKSKSIISVAIFSSPIFDATSIDITTIKFGPNNASVFKNRFKINDINGDGLNDLVVKFKTNELGIVEDTKELVLSGDTIDGFSVKGSQSIILK